MSIFDTLTCLRDPPKAWLIAFSSAPAHGINHALIAARAVRTLSLASREAMPPGGEEDPRMLSRLRHRQRGFTLIELLIVVAIIGIIAALLIPNFLDALQKAKQKRTLGDAKSVGTALFSWVTDQAGAAAAGASATGDGNPANFQSTTQADLTTVLVSQYVQQIPVLDGWKHQYSYYCHYTNPLGGVGIIAVVSYGRDGTKEADDYTVTAFDPTDSDP